MKKSNVIPPKPEKPRSALTRGVQDLKNSCVALFGRGKDPEQKKRGGAHLTVWLAGIFLAAMAVIAFCVPLRPSYSEMEQRSLAAFPTPTVATVLNGAFFSDVGTWFSDTFPMREGLTKLSNAMQRCYGVQSTQIYGTVQQGDEIPTQSDAAASEDDGADPTPAEEQTPSEQPSDSAVQSEEKQDVTIPELDPDAKVETLGALLLIDDAAYEYYNFSSERAEDYIGGINRAAERLESIASVYSTIVPNSMDICVPESVRSGINTSDQSQAIEYFYSSMDDAVTTVNVFDTLLSHSAQGEYLYYRTDHHWTALGAYYAYCEFAAAAGRPVADLETDFEEHDFGDYLGSFYRETISSAMEKNPDTVYAYEPVDTNAITIHWEDGTVWDYTVISDVTDWSVTNKYASAFIGGDNPYSVIENPNIQDGSSILLVKESYGNCFAPFLVESYQYVYVVDFRYYSDTESGTLLELVQSQNIQDVLFLNTISTTRAENLIAQLRQFIG